MVRVRVLPAGAAPLGNPSMPVRGIAVAHRRAYIGSVDSGDLVFAGVGLAGLWAFEWLRNRLPGGPKRRAEIRRSAIVASLPRGARHAGSGRTPRIGDWTAAALLFAPMLALAAAGVYLTLGTDDFPLAGALVVVATMVASDGGEWVYGSREPELDAYVDAMVAAEVQGETLALDPPKLEPRDPEPLHVRLVRAAERAAGPLCVLLLGLGGLISMPDWTLVTLAVGAVVATTLELPAY